jgi:hypothetical protein
MTQLYLDREVGSTFSTMFFHNLAVIYQKVYSTRRCQQGHLDVAHYSSINRIDYQWSHQRRKTLGIIQRILRPDAYLIPE